MKFKILLMREIITAAFGCRIAGMICNYTILTHPNFIAIGQNLGSDIPHCGRQYFYPTTSQFPMSGTYGAGAGTQIVQAAATQTIPLMSMSSKQIRIKTDGLEISHDSGTNFEEISKDDALELIFKDVIDTIHRSVQLMLSLIHI